MNEITHPHVREQSGDVTEWREQSGDVTEWREQSGDVTEWRKVSGVPDVCFMTGTRRSCTNVFTHS